MVAYRSLILLLIVAYLAVAGSCRVDGKDSDVIIGEPTLVCLVISSMDWSVNKTVLRVATKMNADTLSTIRIPKSWTSDDYSSDALIQRINVPRMGTPTPIPTEEPTRRPSEVPTYFPTKIPTESPTCKPTQTPSVKPSRPPTEGPTKKPTMSPTLSCKPTFAPTRKPSMSPSFSYIPTYVPTRAPSESYKPTQVPTFVPSRIPTQSPSRKPTQPPSIKPSTPPTEVPSRKPTISPTKAPVSGVRRLSIIDSEVEATSMSTSTATSDPNPRNTIASSSLTGGGSSIEGVDRNYEKIKDRNSRHVGSSSDIPSRHLASSSPESVFISIESMGKISYQRMYRGDGITYPLNLAIINVEKGKVNSVIWSDTCKWCEDDHCVDNTYDYYGNLIESENRVCFLDDSDCTPANSLPDTITDDSPPELVDAITNSLCELHVYIVWTGTDLNGNYFSSSSIRFDRLDKEQLSHFVDAQRTTLVYDKN